MIADTSAWPINEYSIKSIRFLEMGFDQIKDEGDSFKLIKNGQEIGTVIKKHLKQKTISKLISLCD